MRRRMNARRIAALALMLMMAVSFMPILGGVYATDNAPEVTFDNEAQLNEMSTLAGAKAGAKAQEATKGWYKVTVNKKACTATVTGELTSDAFAAVFVDDADHMVWSGSSSTKRSTRPST